MYKSRPFMDTEHLMMFLNENKIAKENIIKLDMRWTQFGEHPFLIYADREEQETEQNRERKAEKAQKCLKS